MSREIKFRAWFGLPHYSQPHMAHLDINDDFGGASATWQLRYLQHPEPDGPIYMQYTGLRDKNGVEIYEGDILATRTGNLNSMGVMAWSEKRNGWVQFSPLEKFEVIGNIYENGDLLK